MITDSQYSLLGVMTPRKPDGPRVAAPPRPLSALQQLAAKRKAEHADTTHLRQGVAPAPASPISNAQAPAKPMSKLAQLAAQRKAAASASSSAKEQPSVAVANSTSPPIAPSTTEAQKPVSKLAQRIAAAKAAKAQAEVESRKITSPTPGAQPTSGSQSMDVDRSDDMEVDQANSSPLFTFPAQLERNLPDKKESLPPRISFSAHAGTHPSGFFTLLTTPPKTTMHVPGDLEKDALEKRQRRSRQGKDPFEELDPDEAVMKAREGTRLDAGATKARK